MNRNILAIILIVVLSAALALYERNWIWVIVSVFCVILLLCPMAFTGNRDASYNGRVMIITAIPFVLFSAATSIILFSGSDTDYYQYAVMAMQTLAAMMGGYMLFVTLEERTGLKLSKKWVLVFSILFACSVSVLYTFALFPAMVDAGYPMFNADFEGPDALDNTESNTVLMMPMIVTVFASVIYAVIIRMCLRSIPDEEACFYAGVDR
jgi:4-amino-4-deoxy-L-arabinose transferase-like glycosyltransferase